ncbi:DUF4082 domain-containing protein [Acrocarpospora catenulata]|uniref:DUF4082 domain-containing protein n=1 Tax=Acrocarpospora catenulata TaxID=2836182 RepID=UPI001BDADBC9|nr:DUF4082 domain-containing protein [Acrocarpospora catenulata]
MTHSHSHRRESRRRRPRSSKAYLAYGLSGALVAVAVPVVFFTAGGEESTGEQPVRLAAAPAATPETKEVSFWTTADDVTAPQHKDKAPVELGTRFTVAREGWVTGVRFYKAKGEKGKHTGNLWNAAGVKLASVRFTAESATGWQEARFGSPVRVRPGATYTISYHSTNGTYVGQSGFTGAKSGPMTTAATRNAVYRYGKSGFPKSSNPKKYHYYVDPIFRWTEWKTRPVDIPPASQAPVTEAPATTPVETPTPPQTPTPTPNATVSETPVVVPPSTSTPTVTPTPTPTPTPTRKVTPTPKVTPTFSASPLPPDTGNRTCGGFPTPACTGVPSGVQLKKLALNFDGDSYRVTQAGTVLDGVHIPGTLLITADNVTVRNSQIDGQIMGVYAGKRYSFNVSDSTVGPTNRCDTAPGILDAQFTATRVHIRGHGDGFSVSGDNVSVTDSYVKLCSNPGDHSDGIQTVGASKNLTFHHNTVDQRDAPSRTAPVFLVDPTQGVTVTDNLLIGGTYTLQIRTAPGAIAKNNAIVNNSWTYGPLNVDCRNTSWSGNKLVTIDNNYNVTSTVSQLDCGG